MNTVTLTKEYQLAFPKDVRESIGLKAGTSFEVISYDNRIELIPVNAIKKLRGMFRGIDTNIARDDDRI